MSAVSVTSKVRMQACARPRRICSSLALCAWSSSSTASAMRLPLINPGTGITVWVGSGNSG